MEHSVHSNDSIRYSQTQEFPTEFSIKSGAVNSARLTSEDSDKDVVTTDDDDVPSSKQLESKGSEKSSRNRERSEKRLSWILTSISIIICIVSMILMAITVADAISNFQHQSKSEEFDADQTGINVCLPCLKLILDPFNPNGPDPLMDKLIRRWEEDELMCCAETPQQLSVMREAFTRPRKSISADLELPPAPSPSFIRVSAHKQLLQPNRSLGKMRLPAWLVCVPRPPYSPDFHLFPIHEGQPSWEYERFDNLDPNTDHLLMRMDPHYHDPVREHVRGVEVNETAMIIQHAGYYYVYLSALYKANSRHIGKEPPGQFWLVSVHRVKRHDPARGEFLLTIAHSPSPSDMEDQAKHTGYSGGVFLLEKDEGLTVCLEARDTVEFKKESTYLGLYWVRGLSDSIDNPQN